MGNVWWHFVRAVARLFLWAYYRSFRVDGVLRIPKQGPVLIVANHPNALLDAAAVLCAVPRPVKFAAKSSLFTVPVLGRMLRGLGAVPVYRPRDRTGQSRKNLDMFAAFTEHFREGGAAAVYPEGHSHLDPELKEVKSGPARIAVGAETAADFELGLKIVPLGLQYEPKQQFRGEAHVRVGEPFEILDLKDTQRREAIRIVQARIEKSLRPLVVHLDDTALEPLVLGVADVYDDYQRTHPEFAPRPRAEVVKLAGACLNHFLVADPEAVEITARKLEKVRRLAAKVGVEPPTPEGRWRSAFGVVRLVLGMAFGFPFYVVGCLTSYVPYRVTDAVARRFAQKEGDVAIPLFRITSGAVVFSVFWGALLVCVYLWSKSIGVTAVCFVGLVACAYYARFYAERFHTWRIKLMAIIKPGAGRVAAARDDLLAFVNELAARYGEETGGAVLPPRDVRWYRRVRWGAIFGTALAAAVIWFAWGFRDPDLSEMPSRPSPWRNMGTARAEETIARDARSLVGLLDTLEGLERDMAVLRAGFLSGERRYPNVEDDRAVRRALGSYLSCRRSLFRLAWAYRHPDRPGEPALSDRAFVLGYAAAIELARRGMQLIATFDDSTDSVRKLNEGDPAFGLPAGSFDRVRENLASGAIQEELAAATVRYQSMRDRVAESRDANWPRIAAAADQGVGVVARLSDELWAFKWDAAVTRAKRTADHGRYEASKFFANLIGAVRLREGDLDDGLVSAEQVAWLRDDWLEPGDILLQRRNWALSNAFLPGFWTHAAIYTGGVEGLQSLGIADDPRVQTQLEHLASPDGRGDPRLIIEALGPGVVLTSLQTSVGEADAVCVLRPRLSGAALGEAVARAMQHVGKPYDYDFDFFSTDRLVCTELVYQAFQGPMEFPLIEVMGRQTLPANDILAKWQAERSAEDADLRFICFLDSNENQGVAQRGDEQRLVETLERPGLTVLQGHGGSDDEPRIFGIVLILLLAVGFLFFRKRRA